MAATTYTYSSGMSKGAVLSSNNSNSKPHAKSNKVWTIIQISDTHLMNRAELQFVQMNPEQSFHDVVRDIQSRFPKLDAIVHTGDLAQVPVSATYERYLAFMQSWNVPHYQIPGNHDNCEVFPFHQQTNRVHAIEFGTWTLVLLNSAVKGKVDGWVAQEQLHQLQKILIEHAEQHIIVACHHHPFAMQSHWIDQHRLKNAEHLKDVIHQHPNVKLVLFGHVHQDSKNEYQGVSYLSTPSTSVQFKPKSDDFALDSREPGYRVLHLSENGDFETYIQRVSLSQEKINIEISGY